MSIECRAKRLVQSSRNAASELSPRRLMNRHCFIDVVSANSGCDVSASMTKRGQVRKLTLVVMELFGMVAVEFVQKFDDIGISIGPTESVSSTIEAEDQFVWLFGLNINSSRHLHKSNSQMKQNEVLWRVCKTRICIIEEGAPCVYVACPVLFSFLQSPLNRRIL